MNSDTNYPQWYRSFRFFIVGVALGTLMMALIWSRSEPEAIGWVHFHLWPAMIQVGLFVIFGGFEIAFAIRRHINLVSRQAHRAKL